MMEEANPLAIQTDIDPMAVQHEAAARECAWVASRALHEELKASERRAHESFWLEE